MSEMGSLSTNYFFMHVCISNQLVLVPNTPPIVGYIYVSNTNSSGFFQTYRTGASTTGGRRNATSYTASIAYAAPNLQVYIGARNETSGAAYFSNRQCALSYLGDSINDTQASNFYTAVQTFQTSLSRQV